MWLKYKYKFASGTDKVWSWRYLGTTDPDWVEEALIEINDKYSYSDKYRGVDYDVVDHPPSDVLREKIKSCEGHLRYYSEHMEYLNNLLSEVETLERFEDLGDAEPHSWKPNC